MRREGEGLVIWAFATFHASVFVLIALVVAYRGGGLGQALQSLNTAVGLGLFIALWITTYVATRNAFTGLALAAIVQIDDLALTARAIRWGALNGVMFLLVLALVIPGGYAVTHLGDVFHAVLGPTGIQSALFVLGGLIVASAVALVVGGLIGLLFSGVDLILLGLTARLVRPSPGDHPT